MHWRSYLKFPDNPKLSLEAKDLICRLLCDVDHRIGSAGADQIKVYFSLLRSTAYWCSFWMIWLPWFYIFCKVVFIISVILFLGSSLVSRSSMGQAVWDGGSIQAPSKWWAGYTELHEVRGSKQIFFFVCLMHVSFVRYYQAACGRMWPGLVLQVARVCLCEWRKAPVCMWHKAPVCVSERVTKRLCVRHKAPECVRCAEVFIPSPLHLFFSFYLVK